MVRKLTCALALLLAASLLISAAASPAVSILPVPNLVASMSVVVSPKALPANEYAPATWNATGKFATSDGHHPPALREMEFDVDKNVKIDLEGLPICKLVELQRARSADEALETCGASLLGKGEAHVEIAFPDVAPILRRGKLLVFNGGERSGGIRLLIHASTLQGSPAIVPVTVTTKKDWGLEALAEIPRIAGGNGSLIDFRLTLRRTYLEQRKSVAAFQAKCPDGVFKASVKRLLFKNEAHTPGEAAQTSLKGGLAILCTARR